MVNLPQGLVIMTASWCGKKPNWPWKGSLSQWDQERSDQIRVGEAICTGFEALNPVKYPIFDSQEDKAARAKWLSDKKKAKKVDSKSNPGNMRGGHKKPLEHISASGLGLEDFM